MTQVGGRPGGCSATLTFVTGSSGFHLWPGRSILPESSENGHSILAGAQAKNLGVTLDTFSHVPIQFIGRSSWLSLKNTPRIQTTSHSFLQPPWSTHPSPGLRCCLLTVPPPLPCTLCQYIINTAARVTLLNPSHSMSFLCPEPSTGRMSQDKSQVLSVLPRPCMICPLVPSLTLSLSWFLWPQPGWPPDCSHQPCSCLRAFERLLLHHPHGSLSHLASPYSNVTFSGRPALATPS